MSTIRFVESIASGTRLGQFLSVGVAGGVVDTAALAALVELGGLSPLVAKLLAAELAIVVMFAINERWTFAAFGRGTLRALFRRFLKSNLVRVGGVVVALVVLFVLHTLLGVWYLLANVIGIGVGFVVNYVFESLYTWRVQD